MSRQLGIHRLRRHQQLQLAAEVAGQIAEAWLTERIEAWLRRQADPAAAPPIDQQPVDAAQQANGQT